MGGGTCGVRSIVFVFRSNYPSQSRSVYDRSLPVGHLGFFDIDVTVNINMLSASLVKQMQ